MNRNRVAAYRRQPVEKPVENVENFDLSTGILRVWIDTSTDGRSEYSDA